jgi:hypothetical protein
VLAGTNYHDSPSIDLTAPKAYIRRRGRVAMQVTARRMVATIVVACVALAGANAGATAAPKKISGKLTKAGRTVIAIDKSGEAASKRAKSNGKFKLKAPAKKVTLHLRGRDGTYAGPIVIAKRGKKGKTAILGVKAPANLGKIKVRNGYAKLRSEPPRRQIDRKRKAKAKRGVPRGAGNFGRVRSRASGPVGLGLDQDRDGIPGALDIDDDGDLVLDNLDRSGPQRAALARQATSEFGLFSLLIVGVHGTANANAPGLTDQQVEAALPAAADLLITILPGDSAELDCGGAADPAYSEGWIGGLPYCTRGGTGRAHAEPSAFPEFWDGASPSSLPPFPGCCDADDDGYGTLNDPRIQIGPGGAMFLRHGATAAEIGTGDILIQRVNSGGIETGQFAAAMQYVFGTVPALVSYDDGQGNSATVPYPVAGPNPGPPGPGTRENPFPVKAGPNGDVVLTLTFWRPQRRPIPPETGDWIDIGGLFYTAGIADVGLFCRQGTFSETDPNLIVPESPITSRNAGGLTDVSGDQPAEPTNTLTYTLNATQCLGSHGVSWPQDETRHLSFSALAPNAPDEAGQGISFRRE